MIFSNLDPSTSKTVSDRLIYNQKFSSPDRGFGGSELEKTW